MCKDGTEKSVQLDKEDFGDYITKEEVKEMSSRDQYVPKNFFVKNLGVYFNVFLNSG